LLGGALAMDAAGVVALVGSGGGRTTGILVHADGPVPGSARVAAALSEGTTVPYAAALRARGQLEPSGETIPMGVPPESAMFVRGADEMLNLLGGRCVDCGTVSTPPSIHPHCINCGGPKLEPVAVARRGQVHTFVVNHTMPAPFVAPLPIAVLDMDDGARLMLQAIGDGNDLAIGRRVELVLRKYAHERGVPVYGFKAKAMPERKANEQ
jgi:hydroxymethylglutaryl-CoA synthase